MPTKNHTSHVNTKDGRYFSLVGRALLFALIAFVVVCSAILIAARGMAENYRNIEFIFYVWPPNIILLDTIVKGSFDRSDIFLFLISNSVLSFFLLIWYIYSLVSIGEASFSIKSNYAVVIFLVSSLSALVISCIGFSENAGLFGFGFNQPMIFNVAKSLFLVFCFYVCLQFFSFLSFSTIIHASHPKK